MADYLVPPKGSSMVKCNRCGGLYLPDIFKTRNGYFEPCPFCNDMFNTYKNTIPIWRYNLIKFFRSGRKVDDYPNGRYPEKKENKKQTHSSARVLTLKEVVGSAIGSDLIVEDRASGLIRNLCIRTVWTWSIEFYNTKLIREFENYNKLWRCWSNIPPQEQKIKTRWDI